MKINFTYKSCRNQNDPRILCVPVESTEMAYFCDIPVWIFSLLFDGSSEGEYHTLEIIMIISASYSDTVGGIIIPGYHSGKSSDLVRLVKILSS